MLLAVVLVIIIMDRCRPRCRCSSSCSPEESNNPKSFGPTGRVLGGHSAIPYYVSDFREDRREEDFVPPATLLGKSPSQAVEKIDAGNSKKIAIVPNSDEN